MEFIHKEFGYRIYAIDISKYPLISYDGGLKRCLYIQFFCVQLGVGPPMFSQV